MPTNPGLRRWQPPRDGHRVRQPGTRVPSAAVSETGTEFDESFERSIGPIDPWLSLGVFVCTAATDNVYVMFNAAVSSQRRVPAATWSSVWYLLSAFAAISYTKNWAYVGFAAAGSWMGAFLSMTLLRRPLKIGRPTDLRG